MDEVIVITGASRGIGRAVALHLAAPERRLVLIARSEGALAKVSAEVRRSGAECDWRSVDLSSREHVAASIERILQEFGTPSILVLNAGVSNDRMFLDADEDDIAREVQVNYLAPVTILRRVLPGMVERGSGKVVMVNSLTSLVPFPGNATYTATKAAQLALLRSLRVELDGTGVFMGAVLPGYTETTMTQGTRSILPKMSPERVARAVSECLETGEPWVTPGVLNKSAARFFSIFPGLGERVLGIGKSLLVPSKKHDDS